MAAPLSAFCFVKPLPHLPNPALHQGAMYTYPYTYRHVTTPAPTAATNAVAVVGTIYSIAFVVFPVIIVIVVVCCCLCWFKRTLQSCCQSCRKKPPPPRPQRRPSPVVVYRAPPSPKQVQVCTVRTVTVSTIQPVQQPQVARVAACTVREVAVVK
nr:uncharacterized protein LOC126518049 isoform X1 [Dermacentor andersoni]